jgi:hypothetical protein
VTARSGEFSNTTSSLQASASRHQLIGPRQQVAAYATREPYLDESARRLWKCIGQLCLQLVHPLHPQVKLNPIANSDSFISETQALVPIDMNNLYGHALSSKLPVNSFEWVSKEELEQWNEGTILARQMMMN